ncbi:Acyl-CoA desaturase,Fatty acid desaturase domain [Cinara cedri]|uniref:Acyl-CoA desaturase,Fatty acid desaturase domain n=1 Tax=Cinara cedri TaxID=506608 RepID=A0A5E4MN82_9HEMI|nr:Acyl-CoA desaturase,Fatty acid desaturase domain [Cinara cedri]
MRYRLIYTLLVTAQELLFGKKLFFDWQLGDNWALKSMEILEKELAEAKKNGGGDGTDEKPKYVYRRQIVWFNAIGFLILHLASIYGLYLFLTSTMIFTMLWTFIVAGFSAFSVTMGAHRLYTHRSFKCNNWVKASLVFGQTVAGQNCLYVWVRDHRQHHKYSDTNADPHNATRGFFFSHVGWLMVRKHPEVIEKGQKIDMSDLEMDPFVMFQKKYYKILFTVLAMLMPMLVPHVFWGETLWNGFFVCFLLRLTASLNLTWLVNSAAHLYGNKPFTDDIMPVENVYVSMFGLGEGWHNYHHSFPWDYRAAEFGQYFNLTTILIDFSEEMGWVWDKKYATPAMVRSRATKRGDGTHVKYGQQKTVADDGDMPEDDTYDELFWLEERAKSDRSVAQKG